MIDCVKTPQSYVNDDLALLKRDSPLNTRHENQMTVLRRAAQVARQGQPGRTTPRFLTADQWKHRPQPNGDPRPLIDTVLTRNEINHLRDPTQEMNSALRIRAGRHMSISERLITRNYNEQARATAHGLRKMHQAGFGVVSGLTRGDTTLGGTQGKILEEGRTWRDPGFISTSVNPEVAARYATTDHDYKKDPPFLSFFPHVQGGADIQDVHWVKATVQEVLLPSSVAFETILRTFDDKNFLVHKVVQHQTGLAQHVGVGGQDPHLMPYDPAAAQRIKIEEATTDRIDKTSSLADSKEVSDRHLEGLKKVAQSLWSPSVPANRSADRAKLTLNLSLALHVVTPLDIQKILHRHAGTPQSAAALQEDFSKELAGPASARVIPVLEHYMGDMGPGVKSRLKAQLASLCRPVDQTGASYRRAIGNLPAETKKEQLNVELTGMPLSVLEAMTLHDQNLPATLPDSICAVMATHFSDELFNKHSHRHYLPEISDPDSVRVGVAVARSHEILGVLDDFKRLAKEVVDAETRDESLHRRQRDPAQTAAQLEAYEFHKNALVAALRDLSAEERAQFDLYLTDDEGERTRFEQYLTSATGPLQQMARDRNAAAAGMLDAYANNPKTLRAALQQMSADQRAQIDRYLSDDGRMRLERYLALDMRESMARDLKNALHPDPENWEARDQRIALHPTPVKPEQILDEYEKVLQALRLGASPPVDNPRQLLEDLGKAMQPLSLDKLLQMTSDHISAHRLPALNAGLDDLLKRHKLQLLQRQLDQLPAAQQEEVLESLETGAAAASARDGQVNEDVRVLIERYRGPAVHAGSTRPDARVTALQTRINTVDAALRELQTRQDRIHPDPADLARLEQALADIQAAEITAGVRPSLAGAADTSADGASTTAEQPLAEAGDGRVMALMVAHQRMREQLAQSLRELGRPQRLLQKFLNFPEIIRCPPAGVTGTERGNYDHAVAQLPVVMDELTRYLQALPAERETERDQAANFLANILGEPAVGADRQRQAQTLLTTLVDLRNTDDPSPPRLKRFAKYYRAVFPAEEQRDRRMSVRVRNALQRTPPEQRQLELLQHLGKHVASLSPADRTAILLDLLDTQKDLPLGRAAELSTDTNVSVSKSIAQLVETQCFEGWGKAGFDAAAIFEKFVSVMPRAAAAAVISRNDVQGTYLRLVREYMAYPESALPREQRIALLPSLIAVSGELNPRRGPLHRRLSWPMQVGGGVGALNGRVTAMRLATNRALSALLATGRAFAGVSAVLFAYGIAKNIRPAARDEIARCLDAYLAMKDIPDSAGPFDRARAALPLAPVWTNLLDNLARDPAIGARKGIFRDRSRQDKQLGHFLAQSDIEQYRNLPGYSANESMRGAIAAWAPALASLVPLLPSLKDKPHAGERVSLQEQAVANLEKLLEECDALPDEQRMDAWQASVPIFDALNTVVSQLSDKPRPDGQPSLRQWAQTKLADYHNNVGSWAPAWAGTLDHIRQSSAAPASNRAADRDNQERWISYFLDLVDRDRAGAGMGVASGRTTDAWAPALASLIPLIPQLSNSAHANGDAPHNLQERAKASIDKFINSFDAMPADQRTGLVPVRQALLALVEQSGWVEQMEEPIPGRGPTIAAWAKQKLKRLEPTQKTAEATVEDAPAWDNDLMNLLSNFTFESRDSDVRNQAAPAATATRAAVRADGRAMLGTTLPSAATFGTGQIEHGSDGIRRYVEFYDDPAQAYGKVLTNALLNDLGGHAPQSEVFQRQGRTVYAATYADGIPGSIPKTGLTKERADAVLNSCVVDILLKNWDAVGDDRRNLAMTADGQVIRANNDVALPTQTEGRRKPPKHLETTADYLKRLFDPKVNPAYAGVARAAGYDRVRDVPTFHAQIGRIEELLHRHGGWDNYVAATLPRLEPKDRRGLVSMLEARTRDLRKLAGRYHAKRDELNRYLGILAPTAPSAPATWTDRNATAVFTNASGYPRMLNGVQMTPWVAPTTLDGWAAVAGQNPQFNGMPFRVGVRNHAAAGAFRVGVHNHAAAGALILEPDGRIWMTEPTNHIHYGGESHTFPEGKVDPGLSLQQAAIKKVYEETGLQVEITGMLGDYHSANQTTRFFIARRVGGTSEEMGRESQAQHLMPLDKAATTVDSVRDRAIMRDLGNKLSDPASDIALPAIPAAMPEPADEESHNPRD
jgi:ADP-ribose pyrophosphatase YjhB (NUDIX family)